MQIFKKVETREVVQALVNKISGSLYKCKVLWLICGGSNIPLAVEAMNKIRSVASNDDLENLTVGLTDERYGPVGHKDSNWQQLLDAGINTRGINTIPVLEGKSLDETVANYSEKIREVFDSGATVIAQLGIGTDGHIAGILPNTMDVSDARLVRSFVSDPYTRITLTLNALTKISVAYTFVFGPAKREIIHRLKSETIPSSQMPAQILKHLPEAYLYTDQA